jgi:Ras GTPase-activating-like protein IQGAP2/3
MSYSYSPRTRLGHQAALPSPLRQTSTASNGSNASSAFSGGSDRFPPSRSSTLSSNGSTTFQPVTLGHRRGKSDGTALPRTQPDYFTTEEKDSNALDYTSMRKALRPLQQVPHSPQRPGSSPIPEKPARVTDSPTRTHTRAQSVDPVRFCPYDGSVSPPAKPRPLSMAVSRVDSIRAPTRDHSARPNTAQLDRPELQRFQKSSTGHLRTLSKFAESASEDDFAIKSPDQEVVGLQGRRRLQRNDSVRGGKKETSSWASRNWMDQQRQFLQAYEYLCHIGEAKEWIEDIIHKDIPPIVELEEALRDGVTLAEVVESTQGRALRIFRDPKLQWRHSNNYAHFFKFLADVELPDLFRFELVDLYEKKNIPKVIHCIHALSWLLFRKGMVDFRIGNLVGKLQFEDHELEAMQKGLDKSGVSMPNFSGMSAKFAVEPEPEPEPVESEEDRIDRELGENEAVIVDLQAQMRGALVRIRLGNMMQHLWDNEELIADLQSRIRGDWARQIAFYRLDMRRFAITLQSASRGFLIRSRLRGEEQYWSDKQPQVLLVQNLFRGRKARAEVQHTKSKIQRHENGIREFQAAIRGALQRLRVCDRYEQTRDAEPAVQHIQSMIRGALLRHQVDRDYAELKENESQITDLQALSRATFIRQSMRADQENLRQQESIITLLQAAARGAISRKQNAEVQEKLVSTDVNWSDLQSKARGNSLRSFLAQQQEELLVELPHIIDLQAVARGGQLRSDVANTLAQLSDQEPNVVSLQSYMRGFLSRQGHFSDLKALQAQTPTILDLQSACRGFIQRQRTYETLCALNNEEAEIIQMQASARAINLRMHIGLILAQVEEHEDAIVELQSLARGMIVRQKFAQKKKFYKENMEKVIKIQSFVRGRQQGEAYKSLTTGKNPPVSTVKNFVHLLNDSDIDFDEEIGMSCIPCSWALLTSKQSSSDSAKPWYNTCDRTSSPSSTSTSLTSRSPYS